MFLWKKPYSRQWNILTVLLVISIFTCGIVAYETPQNWVNIILLLSSIVFLYAIHMFTHMLTPVVILLSTAFLSTLGFNIAFIVDNSGKLSFLWFFTTFLILFSSLFFLYLYTTFYNTWKMAGMITLLGWVATLILLGFVPSPFALLIGGVFSFFFFLLCVVIIPYAITKKSSTCYEQLSEKNNTLYNNIIQSLSEKISHSMLIHNKEYSHYLIRHDKKKNNILYTIIPIVLRDRVVVQEKKISHKNFFTIGSVSLHPYLNKLCITAFKTAPFAKNIHIVFLDIKNNIGVLPQSVYIKIQGRKYQALIIPERYLRKKTIEEAVAIYEV